MIVVAHPERQLEMGHDKNTVKVVAEEGLEPPTNGL
jgi:hypothetical protein